MVSPPEITTLIGTEFFNFAMWNLWNTRAALQTQGYTFSGTISPTAEVMPFAVTPSLLKLIAEDLGEAFVKNPDNTFNNGYPIFTWQLNKMNQIAGDVNGDGKFNVSDVVLLQKWLLTVPGTKLANWKAADFCEDNRVDVFDLCLMKRALIEQ